MSQSLNNVELSLKERLTVLLVTSPIVSHPSTELLDKVVSSFQFVTDLNSCKLIILADGVKCGKFRPKRGSVTNEMFSNYSSYLDKIDGKIGSAEEGSLWSRTSLVRMTEHLGFGHVVYHGLRMCQTEYVMVVQHDHPFSFSFRSISLITGLSCLLSFILQYFPGYLIPGLWSGRLRHPPHQHRVETCQPVCQSLPDGPEEENCPVPRCSICADLVLVRWDSHREDKDL